MKKEMNKFELLSLYVESGLREKALAKITLKIDGDRHSDSKQGGDGPIDVIYKTISTMAKMEVRLIDYRLKGLRSGSDAEGEVVVQLEKGGRLFCGKAHSKNVIVASADAYVDALNQIVNAKISLDEVVSADAYLDALDQIVNAEISLDENFNEDTVREKLEAMGLNLQSKQIETVFKECKEIAGRKKEIIEKELLEIATNVMQKGDHGEKYKLTLLKVTTEEFRGEQWEQWVNKEEPTVIRLGIKIAGNRLLETPEWRTGKWPVDSIYEALGNIAAKEKKDGGLGFAVTLVSYVVQGVTSGTDALGKVIVQLGKEPLSSKERLHFGCGIDPDILVASAKAYVDALNRMASSNERDNDA